MTAPDRETIAEAAREAGKAHCGMSGNCAAFAVTLNRALDGKGRYVAVDGEHYEFADHVALLHDGVIYDAKGAWDEEDFKAQWGDEEKEAEIEEVPDPSTNGELIRKLADPDNGVSPELDEEALERDLKRLLGLDAGPEP